MRKTKTPVLCYALALLLLFVQQGALVHGISHVPASKQEQQLPHGKVCDQCVVYAQIGCAMASGHGAFSLPGASAAPLAGVAHSCFSLTTLAFHSRAPPFSC